MRLLIPTIAFLIFAFSSPNAQASNCSIDDYDHNGSRMEVQFCAPANASNTDVFIIYTDPRPSLIKHGVGNGTLLFEGIRRSDGSISGQARLFSDRCGEITYQVSGSQQSDRIVLRGNAPRRDGNCRIKSTRPDTLVFAVTARQAPTPVAGPTTNGLRFEDYPAQVYRAPVRSPDISSDPDAGTYRTRLRNAAKGGVNFAGDHVLAIWGCGGNCLMGAVINARSGYVQFLPGTVCCWLDTNENINPIEFRTDSNMLVLTGLINEQEPMAKYYYDFSGRDFKLIATQLLTSSGSANNGGVQPQPQPQPTAQLDICYYDSNGAQHDADRCTLGGDISIARNVDLNPRCRANAGAICQLGNAGSCQPSSNKYSSYAIFPNQSGRCPATFSQAVGVSSTFASTPSGVRTLSSAHRIASSGTQTDVTNFTLINDSSFKFTVKWLDDKANDKPADGGDQTISHPWISRGESWRVERGARTWESHWYAIVTPQGLQCSFSPRQGETVRISQLTACNVASTGNAPPVVQPSCPTGFVFSGGQCLRDVAPAPSCPSGFEFKQGQCQRIKTANPPAHETLKQRAAGCDAKKKESQAQRQYAPDNLKHHSGKQLGSELIR